MTLSKEYQSRRVLPTHEPVPSSNARIPRTPIRGTHSHGGRSGPGEQELSDRAHGRGERGPAKDDEVWRTPTTGDARGRGSERLWRETTKRGSRREPKGRASACPPLGRPGKNGTERRTDIERSRLRRRGRSIGHRYGDRDGQHYPHREISTLVFTGGRDNVRAATMETTPRTNGHQ